MTENTLEKLRILTESAKYDVSCSSSGTVRSNRKADGAACGVGNTVGGIGICHSFAEDGRCISLLKVMLTNFASTIVRIASTVGRTIFRVPPSR